MVAVDLAEKDEEAGDDNDDEAEELIDDWC